MTTALATLTNKLAEKFQLGSDGSDLMATLKATAFKGQVSDAQMTALLIVADQYGLNPWTKEIYAFPDSRNGIVPVVGVDGWARIINSNDKFDGVEFKQDAESCTCIIYRKDRNHPTSVTEYMSECRRKNVGPWDSHPSRMLRHKALIQCARLAFGFVGIFDQDEAERIAEADGPSAAPKTAKTPEGAAAQNAPDGLEAFENEHLQNLRAAAMNGMPALEAAFNAIEKTKVRTAFWIKHKDSLKSAAEAAVVLEAEVAQ